MTTLIIVAMLIAFTSPQENRINWSKIVPFQTTRAEIETMLSVPTLGTGYILSYDTTDDRITVWYGGVKQRDNSPCKWVLPEDVVLTFVYAPKKKFPLAELKLDLAKFQKRKALELENGFYYDNAAEGLVLTTRVVDGEEIFVSLERNPDKAQRQKFCKDAE